MHEHSLMKDTDNDKPPFTEDSVPLVRTVGLCKHFVSGGNRIDILKEASFDLSAGEAVGVVGASGIGKSTFLHLLGTLESPNQGSVMFQGQDVFRLHSNALAKLRNESIGFVFQFHHLLPEFSTLENTMMPALIQGVKRPAAQAAAEEILVRVGLKERLHHRVLKLSGGEQQRVALARALVLKPQLLLADEPTGNLDRKNSDQVHALLMELNQEFDMAMVVVTHNMGLAAYMQRRVTILDGRIVTTE
jgi:lipoprotein-releasing system ATP-binding protein